MCPSIPSASTPSADQHQSPLWISHHWPEHYDRCVPLGRLHVCRRCLVLYPVTLVMMIFLLVADVGLRSPWIVAMWVLPIPMVLEWVAEHGGRARYSPLRQAVLAAVAAPALAIALTEHLRDPFTLVAVAPVTLYIAVCAVSAVIGTLRRPGATDWEAQHESEEQARRAALESLLDGVVVPAPSHDRTSDPN